MRICAKSHWEECESTGYVMPKLILQYANHIYIAIPNQPSFRPFLAEWLKKTFYYSIMFLMTWLKSTLYHRLCCPSKCGVKILLKQQKIFHQTHIRKTNCKTQEPHNFTESIGLEKAPEIIECKLWPKQDKGHWVPRSVFPWTTPRTPQPPWAAHFNV